jgi:hypothetical protein
LATPEVRHRHDRATATGLHVRLGLARHRHQRVGGDVEGQPEVLALGLDEALLQVVRLREGDRVDEEIEATKAADDGVERLLDRGVVARIHLDAEVRADAGGEVADVLLDALTLVGEGQLGTLPVQLLRDAPRDRAPVRDTADESELAFEHWGLRRAGVERGCSGGRRMVSD